ncbi:hypothetical protein FJT64_003282 [Amphibalanus amphitrite]|uniref:27 kDa hemolymph protein n=1 Tax=Amphibalanus amphitrite TaxID=1232801 RepID=A0A6A4W4D9_AMPAM|nr:hypothetical protein FJT64_003282 [Amphibalanus amphitrite]
MGVPGHAVCLLAAALLLVTGELVVLVTGELRDIEGLLSDNPEPRGDELGEAIASLFSAIEAAILGRSSDPEWQETTNLAVNSCQQNLQPGLSLSQASVYALLCIRWSLFADCDRQQQARGELDAAGEQRQAAFLQGDCPLSPQSLKDVLEAVTGRTFEQCGLDTAATYEDVVNALHCLLENFQNGVNMDYDELKSAINAALTGPNAQQAQTLLEEITNKCEANKKSDDFFNCWINLGALSCAYQEANRVAAAIPGQCQLSA